MTALNGKKISFIGAGKAGVSLGSYFYSKNLAIGGYLSRSAASAESAARITSSEVFTDVARLVEHSAIIFITTPDGLIKEVWNDMAGCDIKDRVICHASGSLSSAVFDGIAERGACGCSVHPMYAFASRDGDFKGLENACFTLEGDACALERIKDIFFTTGNRTMVISQDAKTLYHAANVAVSNLVLALVSIGCDCLAGCGAEGAEPLDALMPLVKGNVDNIARMGLIRSLTGPAERNDIATVAGHIEVLPAEYRLLYKILTKRLVMLSQKAHPERDYSDMLEILE